MEDHESKVAVGIIVLVISAVFLFFSLGHYALWDDETETALGGEGVLLTGDTTAILGHNLVARRAGINVHHLHDRFTPPLPIYLTAASMGTFGKTAWAARFPFAVLGLGTIALIGKLLWQLRLSTSVWIVTGVALIGNVPLFLYFRQARYYGVVIFFSVLIGYLYITWKGKRWQAISISLASAGLFVSHQICFLEVNTILLADYCLFRFRELPLRQLQLPALLIPQIIIIGITSFIWNPFLTNAEEHLHGITMADRATLLWWYFRDINTGEFGVGLLLLAAPLAFLHTKNRWIGRGLLAIVLAVCVASAISHQSVAVTTFADIRYVVPVIPICIAVSVMTIHALVGRLAWLGVSLAVLGFWTNVLHGGMFDPRSIHSTLADFARELVDPPAEPYTPTARWMKVNVRDGESVWVVPENMIYPLMFEAPHAVYAWQLANRNDAQFAGLDRIHFQGEEPPRYIIAFGPVVASILETLKSWQAQGLEYQHIATIDTYWRDLYRPELFWRTFTPVVNYSKASEAIYIFKLQSPKAADE